MTVSKLPLAVTIARLIFGPLFVLCFYIGVSAPDFLYIYVGALGYTASALTDMVDGYLARRLNSVTELGARLDPATDIINRVVGLLALDALGITPWWLFLAYTALVGQYALDTWRLKSWTFTLAKSSFGRYLAVAYDVIIAAAMIQMVIVGTTTGPYILPSFIYIALAGATVIFITDRNRSLFIS